MANKVCFLFYNSPRRTVCTSFPSTPIDLDDINIQYSNLGWKIKQKAISLKLMVDLQPTLPGTSTETPNNLLVTKKQESAWKLFSCHYLSQESDYLDI